MSWSTDEKKSRFTHLFSLTGGLEIVLIEEMARMFSKKTSTRTLEVVYNFRKDVLETQFNLTYNI